MDWSSLDRFREAVEKEFERNVFAKPERIPEFEVAMRAMREALYKYGLDPSEETQMYVYCCAMLQTCNFISSLFAMTCDDPHVFGHLKDAVTSLGYHMRDITFACGAPAVEAS